MSPESVEERLFASAINRTRNLICDHTRYMTKPGNTVSRQQKVFPEILRKGHTYVLLAKRWGKGVFESLDVPILPFNFFFIYGNK